MSLLNEMLFTIKKYGVDIAVFILGTALSVVLAFLTSNSVALLGIAVTLFVDLSLFSIRRETKAAISQYLDDCSHQALLDMQENLQVLKVISLEKLLSKDKNKEAFSTELKRLTEALTELEHGKRRIYNSEELYNEQMQIILHAEKTIRAIHVVKRIEDLYQWDPSNMNRESSFYKVLYSTFQQRKLKKCKRKRIIVLPGYGIEEIKGKYTEKCQNADFSELSDQEKAIKEYYEVIERVLTDQQQLNFTVRFITAEKVAYAQIAICDCLIGDGKFEFDFSKSDSADVRAYAIDSEEYIKRQIKAFDELWELSESW